MKLLSDWGFSRESWKTGGRGEFWVALQGLLFLAVVLLPIYRFPGMVLTPPWRYGAWGMGGTIGLFALVLMGKGVLDLGQSLTPLPYPREDGILVQSGVYGIVRHPIYSGVILATLGYAIAQQSLSHLAFAVLFLLFFNAKSAREEAWLAEKYPDYPDYQQRVKKLLPWLF